MRVNKNLHEIRFFHIRSEPFPNVVLNQIHIRYLDIRPTSKHAYPILRVNYVTVPRRIALNVIISHLFEHELHAASQYLCVAMDGSQWSQEEVSHLISLWGEASTQAKLHGTWYIQKSDCI